MSNSGGLFAALLAGCAIGVGLGILYAPDKGEVTRKKMKKKAKEKVEEFEAAFEKNMEKVRDKIDELIDDLEKKIDSFKRKEKEKET
ncbi:YtxH domain-containing protein [Ancylomarina salipaludis]|uniref:YtxH domain-containing protein n=1 Tax=Ancylomarina salipaludis TaxID=2501299 RepID=A0A4Q1JNB6_9BACT|nr:YtxH domain-containing protein [Ancylomarina salipaludis]RXQ95605.1 YtxH domain-containing protein [Ancylomarina salipaludis]